MARALLPGPPCPVCGAVTEGHTMDAGLVVAVPHAGPFGGTGHYVLRGDEPIPSDARRGLVSHWPDGDVWRLTPCGCEVTAEQVRQVVAEATAQQPGDAGG